MDILKEEKREAIETPQLDRIEMEHIDLLKSLALPCTSNEWRFTDKTRLNKIKEILTTQESNYIGTSFLLSDIYTHKNLDTKNIILLTAHCDTIPDKPFVDFNETTGLLHGTFDNLISNAILTILMKEGNIPPNVVFALTGDEETGKCKGCKNTVEHLKEEGFNITQAIALDVTWEGYTRANFSFENFGRKNDKHKDTNLYCSYQNIIDNCADSVNTAFGMYDEGYALKDAGIFESGSICIPVQGNMHTNDGCYCKQKSFEGFILALSSMIYSLTNTHRGLIEEYKMMRMQLKPEPPTYSNTYSYEGGLPWCLAGEPETEDLWMPADDDYDEEDFAPMNEWEASDYLFSIVESYTKEDKELFIYDCIHTPQLMPYFNSMGYTEEEDIEQALSEFFDENSFDYDEYSR